MKVIKRAWDNVLFLFTLLLLAFIPLYPKRPLLDLQHTWVYIRVEDFLVAFIIFIWIVLLLLKKVTLKTPLTLPVLLFWIIGGIATLHGVLLLFPTLSGVFYNVAFLSYLRRIEYLSLFFIAYSAMKEKRFIHYVITILIIVLLLVVAYGFGQKYLGFDAYLTMNEEFAKGIPIKLSELSRVPSTFAGHYDLAAYLVLIIPILTSISFGVKNWLVKTFLWGTVSLGFILLFMTVSRVSFFVLLFSLALLLILQKKRLLVVSLIGINFVFLSFFPSLSQRFGSTVTEIDVLVDATSGKAIGNVKEISSAPFRDKIVVRESFENQSAVYGINEEIIEKHIAASASAIVPLSQIPANVFLLVEPNAPTGEDLPQGTGYINLHLSPIKARTSNFFYYLQSKNGNKVSNRVVTFYGDFLIKRAKAYDLSFTTRFQGEWPNTIKAFERNIFLGSGYGSVSLAVDNNYLRILGESGLLGFIAFVSIFAIAGIYIWKVLPKVDDPITRSFVLGFIAGTFGLALNAIFIDVFEASKIAFTYWLLMGVTIGTLWLYGGSEIDLFKEFKKIITSAYAVVLYLFIATLVLFSSAYSYYFVGDDFTWLRWIADCNQSLQQQCHGLAAIARYFTEADGFFYRPGTKTYYLLMYALFWLNQTVYHLVSVILHFSVAVLVFLIARKILKEYYLSVIAAFCFLILSGYSEEVFWIAATGHLFNAVFALLSLLFFIYWRENKKIIYLLISLSSMISSLLFHELGVVIPLLMILYEAVFKESHSRIFVKKVHYLLLFTPVVPYLVIRFFAQSHWFNGDYSYNLLKLPFNGIGNAIGYFLLTLLGPASFPIYYQLRNLLRDHLVVAIPIFIIFTFSVLFLFRMIIRYIPKNEQKIVLFGTLFFIVSLLPFLGLGNITSRYSYLSSIGIVILFAVFLKKIYYYLLSSNGRYISLTSVIIITMVFGMNHLFQLQKLHNDWHAAGERSERFIISLNKVYSDGWTTGNVSLYFVDVPIRYGDAWIFPVGLQDAVWFVFRNENLRIFQSPSLEDAREKIKDPNNTKVFRFQTDGRLEEIQKTPGSRL